MARKVPNLDRTWNACNFVLTLWLFVVLLVYDLQNLLLQRKSTRSDLHDLCLPYKLLTNTMKCDDNESFVHSQSNIR